MQNNIPPEPIEYIDDNGRAQAPSVDLLAVLSGVLRRWKLITAIALTALIATYAGLKLLPSQYKSTVEILVYDPQRQMDEKVQKTISLFADALGYDAINTEINVLKSKSVALRVATELGLDRDPEFQSHDRIADLAGWLRIGDLAERLGVADLLERLGFPGLGRGYNSSGPTITEERAEKLDRAADALIKRMEISQDSAIISVSTKSQDPIKAQRLVSTIANVYLASQREARQQALDHVATWLKGRVDDMQSRVLAAESSIEKLKIEGGIRDAADLENIREQIAALNTQLMTAREEVNDKRARFEQARHVIDTNGDIGGIPELTVSATFSELRRKQMELNLNAAGLQNKLGDRNAQVVSNRAELAAINKQIDAEVEHVLGNMKNDYDVAVRREQSLEANLKTLTASSNSETYIKLEQLRRAADADRKAYESYLSQYNDIAERRELQDVSARIISWGTQRPSHMKFYALGGMAGLGGGFLLAFLLEYFRSGVKTGAEIEQSFGLPVVGVIPLVGPRKIRGASYHRPLDRMVHGPHSHLSEAVYALRINLELSSANPKVILISSALPDEGKSTTAMLLAASSAGSGKRTILLDCDLRLGSTSKALRNKHRPGLSELLRGAAKLTDVITEDPITKACVIPAGSMATNAADLLMSQAMLDLIAVLRSNFDHIVIDAPPLLPVVDALALATVADKILVVVEWCHTPRAMIHDAFKVLRTDANRVAGIVLNKVDFNQLPAYGAGYRYRLFAKYISNG
ncbi:MAG: polysaccharide biosynthesis tyrosine autokinase [Hyphomicrobiales bacterium]|nr:polysaccharide biosynthesis tyrosine autokinase [Hyphomicrobiales bacterium]